MAYEYNENDARLVLDSSSQQAEGILEDSNQVDQILNEVKSRIADLPGAAAGAFANVPLMVDMIKGYITREYAEVSPKVVASVLGALLYLVKGKDIIPDSIPLLGLVDDIAVIALAMKINEPELEAFKTWVQQKLKPASDGATGTVEVRFVVGRNGGVQEVQAVKGGTPAMRAEAVRTVQSAPKWKPAISDGSPVRMPYTIEVHF